MRSPEPPDPAVVVAARAGDRDALAVLVSAHLPLLYNLVRSALNGDPDVDDVVQETVLKVMQRLDSLRDPAAFRSWLVAVALHQVRDHQRVDRRARTRLAPLDAADDLADPRPDVAEVTSLRLGLSGQRREVAEATRWLDEDDRELLALWWLESAGQMSRADLAAALEVPAAHAAVQVQRMRERLDTAREIVAVLRIRPGCPALEGVLAGWGGEPSPLWRKRIARHLRGCPTCSAQTPSLIAADRLLVGLGLLPVPVALGALVRQSLAGHGGATALLTGQGGGRTPAGHSVKVFGVGVKTAVAVVTTVAAATAGTVYLTHGRAAPAAHTTALPPARTTTHPAVSPAPRSTPRSTPSSTPAKRRRHPAAAANPAAAGPCKKGVATWTFGADSAALKASGACWFYDWGPTPAGIAEPPGVAFVPMIWGPGSLGSVATAKGQGSALLGFNEPDLGSQSNMSVTQALSLWPKLQATGRTLGSPAVATGAATPGGWLDSFMQSAKAKHYRVDFITLHWYGGDFSPADATTQLKAYVQSVHQRYHKPIWVTEYALMRFADGGSQVPSQRVQADFLTRSATMLDALPYVQRYAWFALPATQSSGSGLFTAAGKPNTIGRAFQALPGHR